MAETQAQNPSSQGSSGAKQSGRGQDQQRSESFADQAQSAVRGVADQASDMWDSASDQGQRYYRQGSQAFGNMDGATLGGLFAAGALGFAIAWLIFGQSHASRDVARRMSRSSESYR
ncbi:hypothetical protein [Methylobacterium durans]|uniref:Uncharacterized protein n=1 Tax=Methylobacterium durans TaxID=2202825 RepID=A0A2U8WAL9_9HYPH|nr:hypothetical protein [Methylobacterium durans]AWN42631.1 hypothetical protein DK389_21635 [Methylobacterium durans]